MPKKNDFKLDVVSVRLVKDAPIYSEHTFNNPAVDRLQLTGQIF